MVHVVTERTVGLRFAEGILASRQRLAGTVRLGGVVTHGRCVHEPTSDYADAVEWARRFRVPSVALESPQELQDWLSSHGETVVFAGWPHRVDTSSAPPGTLFGVHPRKLPEGRGRSPIPWTIEQEEPRTAVSVFELTASLDSGGVLMEVPLRVSKHDDATSLYLRVSQAHFDAGRRFPGLPARGESPQLQNESLARTWRHRGPEDRLITHDMTRAQARRRIMAQAPPFPPATALDDGVLRPVDSHASLREWLRKQHGTDEYVFRDGRLPLVFLNTAANG